MIAEEFVGEQEDVALSVFGDLAHLPLREAEPERRSLVERELIAGDGVRPKRDSLLQSPLPDFERLARQAVDQIDRNRIEAGRASGLDALPSLPCGMPASQEFEGVRVEGLNPQGETANAEIPPGANALRAEVLGIRLEGDPGAVLHRKVFPGGREDASDVVH